MVNRQAESYGEVTSDTMECLVKRISLAESLPVVGLVAVAVHFTSIGLDLRRRGFTAAEIAMVTALPIALDIVLCRGVIVPLRRRRVERDAESDEGRS